MVVIVAVVGCASPVTTTLPPTTVTIAPPTVTVTVDQNLQPITTAVKPLISTILYATRTSYNNDIRVIQMGSTLFNDSSYKITVRKMVITNDFGDIEYAITDTGIIKAGSLGYYSDADTILETWGTGDVYPKRSLSVSCRIYETVDLRDAVDWGVTWYFVDENGKEGTVSSNFTSLR